MNRTIDVVLRTVSPMHITCPSSAHYDYATGNVVSSDNGWPYSRMRIEPVFAQNEQGQLVRRDVPILPANGLRGRLRRFAGDEIKDHLASLGPQGMIKVATLNTLDCGAGTISPNSVTPLAHLATAARHFWLGTFGGSNSMVPGALSVSDAWPLVGYLVSDTALVPEAVRHAIGNRVVADDGDLTMAVPQVRREDYVRGLSRRADELVAADDRAQWESLRKATRLAAGGGKKEESARFDLGTINASECVPAGVPFWFRVRVTDRPGPAGLGLLLTALLSFLRHGQHGGRGRVGRGMFVAEHVLLNGEDILRRQGEEIDLDRNAMGVQESLDAFASALAATTGADLDALCEVDASQYEIEEPAAKGKKKDAA